jgi:tetratricopeptide (TPR) repeat protein
LTETSRRKARDLAGQALETGENEPAVLINVAYVLAHLGEDIGAMIGLLDRALALNPSFARAWYRLDEAAATLLLSLQDLPAFPNSYRYLAACYAYMGLLDDARATVARLRAITPQVMPSDLPLRIPEHRDLLLSGLRLAMGETE